MSTTIPSHSHRAAIDAALPHLRFTPIGSLFYFEIGNERNSVLEFMCHDGAVRIPTPTGLFTIVTGNHVLKEEEIWLHRDGTLHMYLRFAIWEPLEYGRDQRTYVRPVHLDEVPLAQLVHALEVHVLEPEDDDDEDPDDFDFFF
jgi:hypothetical protein